MAMVEGSIEREGYILCLSMAYIALPSEERRMTSPTDVSDPLTRFREESERASYSERAEGHKDLREMSISRGRPGLVKVYIIRRTARRQVE